MIVQNDPSDHPRDDPEPREAEFEFPLMLGAFMMFSGIGILALAETRNDHSPWVHGVWVAIMIISFLIGSVFLVRTLLDSSWYAEPLPRTDPDEEPDKPSPPFPNSDHRTW